MKFYNVDMSNIFNFYLRRQSKAYPTAGQGCLLGCLFVGLTASVLALVLVLGIGRPFTLWYRIVEVQAFEGERGIVMFCEVDQFRQFRSLLASPDTLRVPCKLFRVEVSPGGTATALPLQFEGHPNFNPNVALLLKLRPAFYLVDGCRQMYIQSGGRLELLPIRDSAAILRSAGLSCSDFGFDKFDAVSVRNGWRRITQKGPGVTDPVVSVRHKMRVRFLSDVATQTVIVESTEADNQWTKPLLTVNAKPWKTYKWPVQKGYKL